MKIAILTDNMESRISEREQDSCAKIGNGLVPIDLTGMAPVTEMRAASRSDMSLGVVISDIDQFKQFNDLYGRPPGLP